MSRATLVYISMFVLLGAGLWTVLAIGHGLTAPPDLSGYWQVKSPDEDLPFVGDGLELEQSGRYLRLRTAENFRADLKLVPPSDRMTGEPTIRFAGNGITLAIGGLPKANRATMRITGPADVSFDARRTVYQGKTLAKETPSATAPSTRPLTRAPTEAIDDAPER
jgi:hypothetical protein